MKILIFITVIFVFLLSGFEVNATQNSEEILSDTLNGKNIERLENYLVYYSYNSTGLAPTNQWGFEISVNSDNFVVEVDTKVSVYPGGYIISGHGTKKEKLMNVKVGDTVSINNETLKIDIVRDLVDSSLFLVNSNLDNAKDSYSKVKTSFYEFDDTAVSKAISDLELIKTRITELANLNRDLTIEEETLIKSLSSDSTKLLEEVIYRSSKSNLLETRSMWHRPNATSIKEENLAGVKRFVSKVKELGFNTIYIETFLNGFASYRSNILDTHPSYSTFYYGEVYEYDYIAALVGEANKLGIDVHAWSHTFNAGNPTFKSNKFKDEWLVENYQGTTLHPNTYGGAYYLDPSNEEVLQFIESVFIEMIEKYNFAGIQLDYIRYYDNNFNITPIQDSGYGDNAEEKFKSEYGLTGDVRTLVKNLNNRNLWNEWRQNNITNAVKRFSKAINEVDRNIILSASVVSDINQAKDIYMQDWKKWVDAGYIDLLAPMIYTGSSEAVKETAKSIKNALGNLSFLNSGIAPGYYGYSSLINHEQIKATNSTGGSSIFASQNVIGNEDIENLLKIGLYRSDAISLLGDVGEIVNKVLNNQLSFLEKYLKGSNHYEMFKEKVESILKLDSSNPSDYQKLINELDHYKGLMNYQSNDLVTENVSEDIDLLIDVLNVNISREMIDLGFYDPSSGARPNPDDFEFVDEEVPNEEEPIEEKPKNNLVFILSGVVGLTMIIGLILFKRKKQVRGN